MAIPLKQRLKLKPVPNTPEEQARRLAICQGCEWVRAKVTGWCKDCKRPFIEDIYYDHEVVCRCGGEIHVVKDYAKCGDCSCPLASRTHYHRLPGYGPVHCPKGKW
ncbi:hypothetical protein MKP05_09365 [Halomonas sp. EGI 63088]|uniref:Uncharacterized protein n=1 Tax=Halomonas flagellata TaxID=2920385 RepID=A0ABS9RU48_9GAMM|nr:hypothetical protein [Halomonas flagellata]MCH4563337.1 hypothetical protein [Halomonas flagellata]